jgi:MFS family permease
VDERQPAPVAPPSLWSPLRVPAFRNLLVADAVSDIGSFMQSVGAAWLMVSFGVGPMFVAFTQTASALPFLLFALPAGSVGDIVDRRKLLLCAEFWMLAVAIVLAVATIGGWISPWLLLGLTFAMSAGDAFEAPTWRAIFPELVTRENLASASALNGIEFNLARAVGPGLAGLVIAASGVATVFVVNAFSFVGVIVVLIRWQRKGRKRTEPAETVGGATVAAVRYVRYSPAVRTLLVRTGALMFFASALLALLPEVAREASGTAIGYGLLLGSFGAGAIVGALVMQRARLRMSTENLVGAGTAVLGLATIGTGLLRSLGPLVVVALVGGAAWILFVSVLSALGQTLTPDWVRARVQAVYILVFQGGMAIGSAVWGAIAQRSGLRVSLVAAGVGTVATLLLRVPARLPDAPSDLSLWPHWRVPAIPADQEPDIDEGPVLVTVEYRVAAERADGFIDAIHELQRIRRRDGASSWGIFYDRETAGRYLETFIVASWAEHLRQHARLTLADQAVEAKVMSFLDGEPAAHHYIYARTTDA